MQSFIRRFLFHSRARYKRNSNRLSFFVQHCTVQRSLQEVRRLVQRLFRTLEIGEKHLESVEIAGPYRQPYRDIGQRRIADEGQ